MEPKAFIVRRSEQYRVNRIESIAIEIRGDELRLTFMRDELVFHVSSSMLEYIERILSQSNVNMRRLVLDLSHVTQIDSSAVGLFITLKNEMKNKGIGFAIENINENVQRVFRLLDVEKYIEAA